MTGTFCFKDSLKSVQNICITAHWPPATISLSISPDVVVVFYPTPLSPHTCTPSPLEPIGHYQTLPSAHSEPGMNIVRGSYFVLLPNILKTLKIMIHEISGETVPVPPYFQFQFAMVTNYFRIKSPPWTDDPPSLPPASQSPLPPPPRALMVGHGRLSRVSFHIAK